MDTLGQEDAAAEGDLDLTEAGRTIVIQGLGSRSFIDAHDIDRVFHVLENVTVVFRKLTIRNGVTASGRGGDLFFAAGGGILIDRAKVTLENVVVTDNNVDAVDPPPASPAQAGLTGGLPTGVALRRF